MCQACVDVCEKYIPDLTLEQKGEFLMCCTPFPFTHGAGLGRYLKKWSELRDEMPPEEFIDFAKGKVLADIDRGMIHHEIKQWGGVWRC